MAAVAILCTIFAIVLGVLGGIGALITQGNGVFELALVGLACLAALFARLAQASAHLQELKNYLLAIPRG